MAAMTRPDGVRDIFCVFFFLPMTATARPDGVRDIFLFFLLFWPNGNPDGNHGPTRWHA